MKKSQPQHLCVLGLQWGDEGKGKIVDVLTDEVDVVVRYQGGANAGHTIYVGATKNVLHHLPSGLLQEGVRGLIGNGMVVDPAALLEEVEALSPDVRERLYLSERAHVVLPHHQDRDRSRERDSRRTRIGTTLRGIGPAYEDKYARCGVRLGDLRLPGFVTDRLPRFLEERGVPAAAVGESQARCRALVEALGDRIVDGARVLAEWDARGDRFLFEGAQGAMLDIDFGTYPFVTSSSSTFGGLGPGSGFSPRRVGHVVGVTKVYCTRVGEGPFPSEATEAESAPLRDAGDEFGATTGRPRRCGWLDLPALRHAIRINDVDSLALTKADVLSGRDSIPVAVDYRLDGSRLEGFPCAAEELERVEPEYEEWPGWRSAERSEMGDFLTRLEGALGVPVSLISSGPRRDEVEIFEPQASLLRRRT